MIPLFFSLGNRLQLMVIRDSADHPEVQKSSQKSYSIFLDMALRDPRQSKSKEASLQPERLTDPDYFGSLTIKSPGNLFAYTPGGQKELLPDEIEQLIELIKA